MFYVDLIFSKLIYLVISWVWRQITSSVNTDRWWTSNPFTFYCFLLHYCIYCILLARTSNIVLNQSNKMGILIFLFIPGYSFYRIFMAYLHQIKDVDFFFFLYFVLLKWIYHIRTWTSVCSLQEFFFFLFFIMHGC